ncbi:hypothetical protein [Ruminococcus sp.]|uniref:hypothetical protein n=1 Tax=Ruminococcus sp. TaxID=41978 RepID=UPI0025D59A5E|nr:hypothetical protein [Ruminococcus sp.]
MQPENLYENVGAMTRMCLDKIMDFNYTFLDDETEELTEDFLSGNYAFKSFSDGLTECIQQHGFFGDVTSVAEKTAFLKEQCLQNHVPLNPAVIKSWFTDKRPISEQRSRENVFRLCFALGCTLEETTDFFLHVYFECPFNFRIANEAIYFYCLLNHLDYPTALTLQEKADAILKQAETNTHESAYAFTKQIGTELKTIHTEEELLQYFQRHSYEFLSVNQTAYGYANQLLEECTELASQLYQCCPELEEESRHIGKKKNIDLLLFMLLGVDLLSYAKEDKSQSFAKAAQFPELIKSNFPLKMQLSNIQHRKKVSYDAMRKALILLNFYSYFADMKSETLKRHGDFFVMEEDFLTFVEETNDLLTTCGYPPFYARNPYDWLILHCANQPDPLQEFQNAMQAYYVAPLDENF